MGGRGRRWGTPTARAALGTAIAVLVAACGTAGHGAGATALSASTQTISEAGSSLLYPLAQDWASAYQRSTSGVTVSAKSTSSGKGINAASSGSVDIGASDAYLSSGDLVKNHKLLNIPLVISAQTIIYNLPSLSNGTHINLNGTVLADIYSGTITNWDDKLIKQLNQKVPLPSLPIRPVHRSDNSGDTFLFTSYLSTQDPDWDSRIGYGTRAAWPQVAGNLSAGSSTEVEKTCAATPGCVAYNGISFLPQALNDNLGYASLANTVGTPTLPTTAAIQAAAAPFVNLTPPNETIAMIDGPAATGYPIVNYEYAVVSVTQPTAAKASAIKSLLRWALTTGNGSGYLSKYGFQRLPDTLVALGMQQIAEIGS
ncbi:phosphate ABC transporter substrate-binding protein PstS [Trebonia kvetii]|uniref:phosphate ABC transporter substrate-binding protein PstS n=1 Tax=Trebonia kvetii TaxID=2480626 RepID=UPI001651E088|nr:phosphate ABC transporter substrate-binding protein PstS [Trebonia kvetii]